jgi:ribosomal protein L7/L12
VNESLKKVKHLRATVLEYANTKFPHSKVPKDRNPHSFSEDWIADAWPNSLKNDFALVGVFEENLLNDKKLTASDMNKCNTMYKHYMSNMNREGYTLEEKRSMIMEMDKLIEDLLNMGHKINAIKCYRESMKKIDGIVPSLRESKNYVDKLQESMNVKQ